MRWSWLLFAALLVVALAAGLAAGTHAADSPVPSVENPGPRGAKLLRAWLQATGHQALVQTGAELPAQARTVVLVAPEGHPVSRDELGALQAFVRAGGTLVYLAPRQAGSQAELNRWLSLSPAEAPKDALEQATADDPGGATFRVSFPGGPLAGVAAFRLSASSGLKMKDAAAVPVAEGGTLWWKREGLGEIFVGAGPDLAENRRLDLADNLRWWAQLAARGPMAFDEFHQAPKVSAPLSVNLIATFAQLAFLGLVFAVARGVRLGPPRATLVSRHRSSLEYVDAMANLIASAHVELELSASLRAQMRATVFEQLGLATSLSAAELGRELQRRFELDAGDFERLDQALARGAGSPEEFARLSAEVARLELTLRGAAPSGPAQRAPKRAIPN